jgi:acetyl esterase/lipase
MFSPEWLAKPDESEYTKEPFPTNGDRIAASEVAKRKNTEAFTRTGFIAQAIAAGWHHKTPTQLKELGDKIGRERIMVLHGGIDRMITFPHGEILLEGLGGKDSGVTVHFEPGQGHVFLIEMRQQFREWLEELIGKTEKLS